MLNIGVGSFSVVYKVQRISDQKIYALKKVNIQNLAQKEQLNALNEVRILASIKHENVIGFKEAFIDDDHQYLCLVIEYADGCDLQKKVRSFSLQKYRSKGTSMRTCTLKRKRYGGH